MLFLSIKIRNLDGESKSGSSSLLGAKPM